VLDDKAQTIDQMRQRLGRLEVLISRARKELDEISVREMQRLVLTRVLTGRVDEERLHDEGARLHDREPRANDGGALEHHLWGRGR